MVSVIITNFNYGRFLKEAVQSVLAQTYELFEIIIVDDGSTDDETFDVLQRYDQIDKITIVRLPKNDRKKPSYARNFGIEQAKGKYICCLDADDKLEKTYIERAVRILEAEPQYRIASCLMRKFEKSNSIWAGAPLTIPNILKFNCLIMSSVYYKDDWKRIGEYSLEAPFEDWDFWIKMAYAGIQAKTIQEFLFFLRTHGQSQTDHVGFASHVVKMRQWIQEHYLLERRP